MRHDGHARAGSKHQPSGYGYQTADYDLFQVISVSEGELVYSDPAGEVSLGPGSLAVLRMGSSFRLSCPRESYRGVFFLTLEETFPDFRGPSYHCRSGRQAAELAAMMAHELTHQDSRSTESLLHLGFLLAVNALRQAGGGAGDGPEGPDELWSSRIRSALRSSLYSGEGVEDSLESLGLSYRQLCRHFRASEGCGVKSFQVGERIREAEKLLSRTRLRITEIAHELGYPSSQYFSTQFRQRTGRTPGQYRSDHGLAASITAPRRSIAASRRVTGDSGARRRK